MPRFDHNPKDAAAGIPVYPKGRLELILGEPSVFYRTAKDATKEDNYGVGFKCKIAEGEFKGKPAYLACYMHTEDSRGFSKQVQMAVFGFNPKDPDQEAKFNESEFGELDWSFDTDTKMAGEGWHKMAGTHIFWDVDVQNDKATGNLQQKSVGYYPVGV